MGSRGMKGKPVTCPRCNYTWYTKSDLFHVTCPNCQYKVKVKVKEK